MFKKAASLAQAIVENQRVLLEVSTMREKICLSCPHKKSDGKHNYCGVCGCRVSSTSNRIMNLTTYVENLPKWGCKHPQRSKGQGWPPCVRLHDDVAIQVFTSIGYQADKVHKSMRASVETYDFDKIHVSTRVLGATYVEGKVSSKIKILGVRGPLSVKALEAIGIEAHAIGDIAMLIPADPKIDRVDATSFDEFRMALAKGTPVKAAVHDPLIEDLLAFYDLDGSEYNVVVNRKLSSLKEAILRLT